MSKDPWENANHEPTLDEEGSLSPLNAIRRAMQLPYEVVVEAETTAGHLLQGEAADDDIEFKAALKHIANEALGREPGIIYYPGCGTHVSLAVAFPRTRAIFADTDGAVQHAFVQRNMDLPDRPFEFYRANMHTFVLPDGARADITILLNAGRMAQEELDDVTADDGLVIVNDWHGAVTYMTRQCPGYLQVAKVEMGDQLNDLYAFRRTSVTDDAERRAIMTNIP